MASDHDDTEQITPDEPENDRIDDQTVDAAGDETEQVAGDLTDKRNQKFVYAALGAGGLVLAVLLLIVWLSARDEEGGEVPLCLDISAQQATEAILAGEVEEIDVLIDQGQPLNGLTAIQLRMLEGECRRLPEGADNREGLFQILGAAELYNTAGTQRIDVRYQRQDVPSALLNTSTPEPTATTEQSPTPEPTETIEPTSTSTPTEEPTAEPTATEQASPVSTMLASPVASPEGSPVAASPEASPAAATPSPRASPSPDS